MESILVVVDPRPPVARVLAVGSSGETLLKARLSSRPSHPRALATLLEALALWQQVPIRAALAVGEEEPWCDTGRYLTGFEDVGFAPLYTIELVERMPRLKKRRRGTIAGMGDFRDLRQMTFFSGVLP